MSAISPKFSTYFNGAFAVVGVVALLSPSMFPDYIPPGIVRDIIQTAGLLTALFSGVNTYLHGNSSAAPGPFAAPHLPETVAEMKATDPK